VPYVRRILERRDARAVPVTRRRKNPAAVELGKKRWRGKTQKEKGAHMAAMVKVRWDAMTPEERSEHMKKVRAGKPVKR
jgi:hypothetical protein